MPAHSNPVDHLRDDVVSLLPEFPFIHSPLFSEIEAQGFFGSYSAAAQQLHQQGYVIVDLGRDRMSAIADQIQQDTAHHLDLQAWREQGGIGDLRVQDAWKESDAVRELALLPDIHSLLKLFWGRTPFAFQTLNFPVGTRQHIHSDAVHFHSEPPGFMCGVWVALEDVHPDAGPLEYYPGSHRLPYLQAHDVGIYQQEDFIPDQTIFHSAWSAEIESNGLQQQVFTPRLGQALIWTANLLHGGAPVVDLLRTRWSQVTHYFFEGCQWYTPMLSDWPHGKVAWRRPLDIKTGKIYGLVKTQHNDKALLIANLRSGKLGLAYCQVKAMISQQPSLDFLQLKSLRECLSNEKLLNRLWPLLESLREEEINAGLQQDSLPSLSDWRAVMEPELSAGVVDDWFDVGSGMKLVFGWSTSNSAPEIIARGRWGSWFLASASGQRLSRPDVQQDFKLDAYQDSGFFASLIADQHEPINAIWLNAIRIQRKQQPLQDHPYLQVIDDLLQRCQLQLTPLERLPGLLDSGLGDALLLLRETLRNQNELRRFVSRTIRVGAMSASAEVTVVVPLYRRWDFVLAQVAGFAQDPIFRDGRARLLYVIDDPSIAEEVCGWCSNHLQEDVLDVELIFLRRNLGFSLACNIGVSCAETPRVCLLNSDVLPITPGWLLPLLDALDQEPESLLAPLLLYETGLVQHAGMELAWLDQLSELPACVHPFKGLSVDALPHRFLSESSVRVTALSGAALLFECACFQQVGGFDPVFGRGDFEDLELSLRWRRMIGPVQLIASSRLTHLERQSIGIHQDRLVQWRHWLNSWFAKKLCVEISSLLP